MKSSKIVFGVIILFLLFSAVIYIAGFFEKNPIIWKKNDNQTNGGLIVIDTNFTPNKTPSSINNVSTNNSTQKPIPSLQTPTPTPKPRPTPTPRPPVTRAS